MMRLLLLSRYGALGASSRVRYFQYLPYLAANGIDVTTLPLLSDSYIKSLYGSKLSYWEVVSGYWRRLNVMLKVHRFDLLVIEKELFPYLPALAERMLSRIGIPYLVDYDDALFHQYDQYSSAIVRMLLGQKIDIVMRHSAMVVAGNSYLADRAWKSRASKVIVIPTVVDAERYQPVQHEINKVPIIGWVGTPVTSHYLAYLLPVFTALRAKMAVRFVAVGAKPEYFSDTPVEVWPWNEQDEVTLIQKFDVGIMPLQNSPWERGKCGYKLIQYMACGLPVVASPVGANEEIVKQGENGYLADNLDAWEQSLCRLLRSDVSYRNSMGAKGRNLVEKWYSLKVQAPRLLNAINEVIG